MTTKEENKVFAERLQKAMNLRGLRQRDIVKSTGLTKGAVSMYVSGLCKPTAKNLYLLSHCLNVSEEWLMGFDVPMQGEINELRIMNTKLEKALDKACAELEHYATKYTNKDDWEFSVAKEQWKEWCLKDE